MQAYVNMYKASGDCKYLDKLYKHIKAVLSNRDDKIGKIDYKGEKVPCWGTDRYTKKNEWMHFVAHTGMITYPMLEFFNIVKEQNIKKYTYEAAEILKEIEESIRYHNKDWEKNHYIYPSDFYKKDYIVPINQQAAMGRSLLFLYKLTGNQEYYDMFKSLGFFVKEKSIKKQDNGNYLINGTFLPGYNIPNENVEDISHATITIHFAYLAYKEGVVFNRDDMYCFASTIKYLAQENNNRFPKYLDGSGNFNYEVTAGQYAFLSEFDKGIYNALIDLFVLISSRVDTLVIN